MTSTEADGYLFINVSRLPRLPGVRTKHRRFRYPDSSKRLTRAEPTKPLAPVTKNRSARLAYDAVFSGDGLLKVRKVGSAPDGVRSLHVGF